MSAADRNAQEAQRLAKKRRDPEYHARELNRRTLARALIAAHVQFAEAFATLFGCAPAARGQQ